MSISDILLLLMLMIYFYRIITIKRRKVEIALILFSNNTVTQIHNTFIYKNISSNKLALILNNTNMEK